MTSEAEQHELKDMMVRYVLGDLSGGEQAVFERRLAEDPQLAAEVAELQRTLDLVPYASAVAPPPHLRARVLEAARAGAARESSRPRLVWRWSPAIAAAAALLAVVFGADAYRLRQELRLQKEVTSLLQQPNVVLSFSLDGTGEAAGAFGTVVLDLDDKKAAVVLRQLPGLTAGEVYRLWALVGDKHVPCGQFAADANGAVEKQFVIPVDAYDAPIAKLILTREASAPSEQPAGPMVMVSS